MKKLQKENERLKMENEILKKQWCTLHNKREKMAFAKKYLKVYNIRVVCRILGVSRSVYYRYGKSLKHEEKEYADAVLHCFKKLREDIGANTFITN